MRRGHEESAQFWTAPGKIGHDFRDVQLADQLARRGVDPDATRTRDPDIAALVAFHPVRAAILRRRPDFACEQTLPGQRAVGRDVEHADQFFRAVVDVEQLLIGREAEAVRLLKQLAIDDELQIAAVGRHAIDALETKLPRPLDPENRRASIIGIGEIDRAIRTHADVVRAVELLALEMAREHLARSVRLFADEQGRRMLANDEVEIGVIGHAVAFVGRPLDLDGRPRAGPSGGARRPACLRTTGNDQPDARPAPR